MTTEKDSHPNESPNANLIVFETIRDGLANGTIEGDPTLSESVLMRSVEELHPNLAFSRLHVRRAVAALEAEGLLRVFPKKGTELRRLTDSELREIWHSRVAIEEFILIRLAVKENRKLEDAIAINQKMFALANRPASPEKHREILQQDKLFHEALASAAGYPGLAKELSLLRLKLQVAVPVRQFDSQDRYYSIVREHEKILDAIGKPRSNLNEVRLAFLVHMKNSSRDSWKIESRVRESVFVSQCNALDAPEFDSEIASELMPLDDLLQMRLHTEFCAVGILAARPGVEIKIVTDIHTEMCSLLRRVVKEKRALTDDEQHKFLGLDLSFHSAICYASGMLFGEDVVSYAWHQVWERGDQSLTVERCDAIVRDHEAVLNAIRRSCGSDEDIQFAKKEIENHLLGTFIRNNFQTALLQSVIDKERKRIERLEKVLEHLSKIEHGSSERISFRYGKDDH